jgi:hypothetical protein
MPSSNGGWQSLDSAPRDRFLLLLFLANGTPQSTVGSFDRKRNRWVARVPHGGDPVEINPRRWHPLPALPSIEF